MIFPSFLSRHSARAATLGLALVLFGIARANSGETAPADTGLRFAAAPLGATHGSDARTIRTVNPRYRRIDAWISAVGAGVAAADIDGDGRPNDLCHVDPVDDSVTVLPAPDAPGRYRTFTLPRSDEGYAPGSIAPMGCLPGDFNEDGRTDLLVYFWGRPPVIHSAGSGAMAARRFSAAPLVAAREAWYTNAALQADVDGDGLADLLFGNYFPEDARVLDASAQDGGSMQSSMSRAYNGGRNRLFLRDPVGAGPTGFTDHSAALSSGMAKGWTLAMAAADLDGDLMPELYVANDFGPDRLLVNLSQPGRPSFRLAEGVRDLMTPRSRTLGRDSFKGMGAEFFDANGDGRLDLAVSNIAQDYALLESHFLFLNQGRPELLRAGRAEFVDESGVRGTARNGWGWDIKAADFDNDGRAEILQALGFRSGRVNRWPELQELATANDDLLDQPEIWPAFRDGVDLSGRQANVLYGAGADGRYRDVARASGMGMRGVSRGIAIADFDLDGRLDAAISRQWEHSLLFQNRTPTRYSFLSLDLRVPNPNGTSRPAYGATVMVHPVGGTPMIGLVDGGNGHSGKRAPLIHFGLGERRSAVPVTVSWRDRNGVHRVRARMAPGHHRLVLAAGGQA